MEDPVQVNVSGDTPEAVAFALYQHLLAGQHVAQTAKGRGDWAPPKDWILQTYAECLAVVKSGSYDPDGASKQSRVSDKTR